MTGELFVDAALTPIPLEASQFLGIPIALIGAVFLSIGAQLQHRGVSKVEAQAAVVAGDAAGGGGALGAGQLKLLLVRPSWVIGTMMLGLAIVFQLTALVPSTLAMVQPLGAVSLVITAVVNARVSRIALNRKSVMAISLCVGGVGVFVFTTAFTTRDVAVTDRALIQILLILSVVVVVLGVLFALLRKRFKAIYYIVGAGVLYGFVATLAKVVISRVMSGEPSWLLLPCILGVLVAVIGGAYFVQNAYASGPPDLVIAGLTVIDPLVAVTIGLVILREAVEAPLWAEVVYVLSGAVAIWGVFLLAKHHPQVK